MLAFLLSYIYDTEQASFLCFDKLSYYFQVWISFQRLVFHICKGFFVCVCQCHFLWDIFTQFVPAIFSFMSESLFSLTSSGSAARVSQNGSSASISMVGYFFYKSVYIRLELHFQCYHFVFLLYFLMCWPVLFGVSTFVTYHMCLSLGARKQHN